MKISEQGIKNLSAALAKFQEEVRNPANTATNPQFRSKYAPLDVVINTAKPVLAKNGLSFLQSTGAEGESIIVKTLLLHESGEWIESDQLVLPAYQIKGGGVKEFNAQGAGSSLTYARRYSLSAMLGLSSEDDDDANGQVFGGDVKGKVVTPTTTPPANNREKAVATAKEKAKEKDNKVDEKKESTPPTPTPTETPQADNGKEPINDGQIKAVGNMLKIIGRKKGSDFNEEAFLEELLGKYGKTKIEELAFEEGKSLVTDINAEMRK